MKTHRARKQRSPSDETTQRTRSSKEKTTRASSPVVERKPSRLRKPTTDRPLAASTRSSHNLELEQRLAARSAEPETAPIERRGADQALQTSEEQARHLIATAPIGIDEMAEAQTRKHVRGLEFLSQTGWELVQQDPATDMLAFVGERVWSFAGDAIVIVNSYDALKNQTTVQGLYSQPEEREQIVRLFGRDPVGLAFTVIDKYRALMIPGKLNLVPGGLYGLCFEQVPEPFCREAEAALNVQSIYAAVFAFGDELLGTLAILSHRAGPLPYASVVETFLNQAAVAVQRWHAERALRESEKRYRQIVETAREGILVTDAQSIITYVNQQLAMMFGYAPEEMIGQPSMDLMVYPEDRNQAEARWKRRQGGLSDLVNEFRYRRKDGSPIWVILSASPLQDRAGKFMGTLALMSDVTERKRAEVAAQRTSERFQLLSEITARLLSSENPQAIVNELCSAVMKHLDCQAFFNFLVDEPSGRLHLNAYAGIPEESARPMEWLDIGVAICGCVAQGGERIIAEDIQNTQDVRADLVRSFGIQAYACHPLLAQGRVIGTLSFGTRTRIAFTADELNVMKTVADQVAIAMQRIRTERALRQRKEELEATRTGLENEKRRLEAVMEALPVGVAIIDAAGGNVQSNSAFEQIWGAPRPPTESVNDYAAYQAWWVNSGEPIAPTEWASAQAVQKGIAVVGQFLEIQRFDGSRAFVINSASPVRDANGTVIGSAVAIQDVTSLKRAEERIQKLSADTEQRAQELQVANEELERLATSLAYDLRSPLVSIHSVAHAIAQDYGTALAPQALELFKLIHANAEEMEQLTQGLLRLMRITRQPMHKQVVNPGEIVRAVWRELEPEYADRTVEIKIGDLPECNADPLLLKEVWKELLSNALKFTRARPSARIEVGATLNPVLARQVGTNGEGGCTYYVRDNGVGFEMSYAGRIFRPFQRYHHPDEFGGAGVGLAIVERVIRRHGGRVWAEGAVNQGATVYFAL